MARPRAGAAPRLPAGELALGALALGLLGLVLTTALPPRPHYFALLNDAGHAPVFGAFAWVVLRILDSRMPAATAAARLWSAFGIAVLAGAAVEFVQSFMDRESSWGDLLMDAAGAGAVLCLTALWRGEDPARAQFLPRNALLMLGAGVSVAAIALPLVLGAAAYARRQAWFPVIASFENASDLYFVAPINSRLERIALPPSLAQSPAEPALKVSFVDPAWPGVQFWEPEPDWRRFQVLRLDVVNPGALPLKLGLRIEDDIHDQTYEDRFNLEAELPPSSRQVVTVPLADVENGPRVRTLDLGKIARVAVFEGSGAATPGRTFYVTRIWLE